MKRLIVAITLATTLAPLAYAGALNSDKDCSKPLSDYGIQFLESSPDFSALKPEFNKAMKAFCEEGRSRSDIGFPTAEEMAGEAADKWMAGHDPKTKDLKAIGNLNASLYDAWLGGYTGFDLPYTPKAKVERQPMDISKCDELTKKAIQESIPPNVTITLEQYKQALGKWGLICLTGLSQGYNGKPRNSKGFGMLNESAESLYNHAYDAGAAQ